jgi:hypothetical protein
LPSSSAGCLRIGMMPHEEVRCIFRRRTIHLIA